jgi:hypothetical protein
MRDTRRKKTEGNRGRVASKVPCIDFDIKAIEEVKKRKRGIYERWQKRKKVS